MSEIIKWLVAALILVGALILKVTITFALAFVLIYVCNWFASVITGYQILDNYWCATGALIISIVRMAFSGK